MRDCCSRCPCVTNCDSPSPKAIERLHSMQSGDKVLLGCDWTINSQEHNYCFWEYAKTLYNPVSDKEICALLGITQAQLKDIYTSAIKKIKNNIHLPEIKEFVETVKEIIASEDSKDDTSFLVDYMRSSIDGISVSSPSVPEKGKPGRKPKSMPTHKDGKKVDIYFAQKNKPKLK